MDRKKLCSYIIVFALGAALSLFLTKGGYSRAIDELSAKVTASEELNTELRATNKLLADKNKWDGIAIAELRKENAAVRAELAGFKNIISGIGSGLGKAAEDIQGVIDGLGKLKEEVQSLPN